MVAATSSSITMAQSQEKSLEDVPIWPRGGRASQVVSLQNEESSSDFVAPNKQDQYQTGTLPSPQAQSGPVKSIIPCTKDDTYCIIEWPIRRISVQTGKLRYNFPFARCAIQSVWTQRSLFFPDQVVRRAVLCVQGFTEWRFTLAPEAPVISETLIPLLCECLHYVPQNAGHDVQALDRLIVTRNTISRRTNFFENFAGSELCAQGGGTYDNGATLSLVASAGKGGGFAKSSSGLSLMWGSCMSVCSKRMDSVNKLWQQYQFSHSVFGDYVSWKDEPVFPTVIYAFRHGQQLGEGTRRNLVSSLGPRLSPLGQVQSLRVAECLLRMTGGFKKTEAIWSSRSNCSSESADIVKLVASQFGHHKKMEIPRIYNDLLSEYLFPFPYQIIAENDEEKCSIERELAKDTRAMEDSRALFAAALNGQGSLAGNGDGKVNANVLAVIQAVVDYTNPHSEVLRSHRVPAMSVNPAKVAGVYVSTPPALRDYSFEESRRFIYSAHGNTLRHQVSEEIGFPPHFWRHVQVPHGAIIITGLNHTGRPAMIVGDAGYIVSPPTCLGSKPALPLTFTPAIEISDGLLVGPTSHRERLATDQTVSLLRNENWGYGRFAADKVLYKAPPEVEGDDAQDKIILMIRTGHNRVRNNKDAGLTELGEEQITAAATWIGSMLNANTVVRKPQKWCVAGLTSQWSTVDDSLKQSILTFRRVLGQSGLSKDSYGSDLLASDEELYPENLFAPAAIGRVLYVVFADDYHLFKYLGACFEISPKTLRSCYWPHGGHLLITVARNGWPELRTFGMCSHLLPSHLTYASEGSEGAPRTDLQYAEGNLSSNESGAINQEPAYEGRQSAVGFSSPSGLNSRRSSTVSSAQGMIADSGAAVPCLQSSVAASRASSLASAIASQNGLQFGASITSGISHGEDSNKLAMGNPQGSDVGGAYHSDAESTNPPTARYMDSPQDESPRSANEQALESSVDDSIQRESDRTGRVGSSSSMSVAVEVAGPIGTIVTDSNNIAKSAAARLSEQAACSRHSSMSSLSSIK